MDKDMNNVRYNNQVLVAVITTQSNRLLMVAIHLVCFQLPSRNSTFSSLRNEERNAVKKALKLRGVDMRAEEMNREYNHRTGAWEYSNEGTMLFGDCLRVDYTVDEKTKAIHFGKASSRVKPGSREMNATLLEMDKATLSAQITRDYDAALTV